MWSEPSWPLSMTEYNPPYVKMLYYKTNILEAKPNFEQNKLFLLSRSHVNGGMIERILERCKVGVYFVLPNKVIHSGLISIKPCSLLEEPKFFELYVSSDFKLKEDVGVINTLLSLNILRIKSFNTSFHTEEFRSNGDDGGDCTKILFIFPGSIYPRTLGSHQRAISVLLSLVAADVSIDILHSGPTPEERKRMKPILSVLANKVCPYNNRARGRIKRSTRKKMGLGRLNEFDELIKKKVTPDLVNQLNKMCSDNNYDSIIINYCWLLPATLEVKEKHPNVKIICDTHDIQFYRNGEEEPNSKEAKSELRWLNYADHIITISHRDEKIVSPYIKNAKISTFLPTFDYLARYTFNPNANPLMFGFIGNNMQANVESLKFVMNNWWPSILKFSPESKFFVAGSVCNNEEYQNTSFLRDGVESLGFVDSLSLFYKQIDVLLSPVIIRGGLNFKNAEVLVAGKLLLTNENGADALKPLNLPFTAESAEEVIKILTEIAEPDNQYLGSISSLADEASKVFNCSSEELKQIVSA